MKIILFSRYGIAHTAEQLQNLFRLLEQYGFDYEINVEFANIVQELTNVVIPSDKIYPLNVKPQSTEAIMLCFGGDGTLLEGIRRLEDNQIAVAGVNLGHLGFLTSVQHYELEAFLKSIAERTFHIQKRMTLEVEGVNDLTLTALNEVVVHRQEASMLRVKTKVNGQVVARYNGDGVIISTPTGSTAYSLSAGGPIISPDCDTILLTPLAPHNFGVRPLVVPAWAEIELEIDPQYSLKAQLSVDNKTYSVEPTDQIKIRRSQRQILLVVSHNISFYETLRNKMMWDTDIRN